MPSDSMPDIAREGGMILCEDVDGELMDGRVYIFMLDWRPLVRRVAIRPEGIVLKASDPSIDPFTISRDHQPHIGDDLVPIARILGDRKSVVSGKSVSVRLDPGGRRSIKK